MCRSAPEPSGDGPRRAKLAGSPRAGDCCAAEAGPRNLADVAITLHHGLRPRDAMRDLVFGAAFALGLGGGLTILEGDAAAGLTAEIPSSVSAAAGGVRARMTLAKAKKKKPVGTVSAKASDEESGAAGTTSALEFGVGARALFRNLQWSSPDGANAGLGPYSLTPGPETGLWLEFYPAAFGMTGFAANVGIYGSFNYGFGVATTLANGTNAATTFRDFQAGLKLRIPVGTFIPNVSNGYGQQTFAIAQQQATTDLPQ